MARKGARKARALPRDPPAFLPDANIDARIRKLSADQRSQLMKLLKSKSAIEQLAEVVAMCGAPQMWEYVRPADWVATLEPIADALAAARAKLRDAPVGARTRIASRLHYWRDGSNRVGLGFSDAAPGTGMRSDAYADAEEQLALLECAARSAADDARKTGRPADSQGRLAAQSVRLVLVHAGVPLKSTWPKVLSIVLKAAGLRRDAETLIATLKKTERSEPNRTRRKYATNRVT